MAKFSAVQKATLSAICDAFIPSIEKEAQAKYWKRKATDLPMVKNIEDMLLSLPEEKRKDYIKLIDFMGSFQCGLLTIGFPKPFTALSFEQQTKVLRRMSDNFIPKFRAAFSALKKSIVFNYYSNKNGEGDHADWALFGYEGALKAYKDEVYEPSKLGVHTTWNGKELSCEVLVIGSGAGGGVAAARLAAKGRDVIVVDKGDYVSESKMTAKESMMIRKMYEQGGLMSNEDGGMTVLAGSCIGGGTTVNWSASLRTPDYVLEEWAKEHDNPQFADAAYQQYFDFIEQRTKVNTDLSIHNPQNQVLADGSEGLGYSWKVIPRNVAPPMEDADIDRYWKSQGYGGLGDSFGYKQGTMKTFLADAEQHGARIFANMEVTKILHANGKVKGAEVLATNMDGHLVRCFIKCEKVVVAAGAIHTPALLMKSGLHHPQIGQNLYLHPVNAVSADYDFPIKSWEGPMMSALCDEFARLDGNFGYLIETPPSHIGFGLASMPWISGEQFKTQALNLKNRATFIVLTRDKFGGQIKLDSRGNVQVSYKLNAYDKKHLLHGIKESCKIHEAAGAKSVHLLHNDAITWQREEGSFDKFVGRVDKVTWSSNGFL